MANYNRSSLVLSVNCALWGEVTPNMRQVSATITHGALMVQVVFDGKPDVEVVARIAAIAGKDFAELKVKSEGIHLDAPAPLSLQDGWNLIYRRSE